MSIPITELKAKYEELSELFITHINNTTMTLYFTSPILSDASVNFDDRPKNLDTYGGKQPIDNLMDRYNQAGENKQETTLSEDIKVRAVWSNKKYDKDTKTFIEAHSCKIITYVEDSDKLRNAAFAIVNATKVKMYEPPVPYGLFGSKQYCLSRWEVM